MEAENNTIPCSSCFRCTDVCPVNIPIPKFFMVYNTLQADQDTSARNTYQELHAGHNGPEDCIRCGRCEPHCPEHLGIVGFMQDVAEEFEE